MAADATVVCGACGKRYQWKPELAGKSARCKCGQMITIPAEPPAAAEPEEDIFALKDDSAPGPTPRARRP